MADIPSRNQSIRQASTAAVVVASAVGLIFVISGLFVLKSPSPDTNGGLMVVAGFLLSGVTLLVHFIILLTLKIEANISRIHGETLDLQDTLRRIEPLLKIISDNSQISDAARSITNREKDREALRQAIREEMYGGDWEAAHYLIDDMERRFGYKQEAQALRAELTQVREMTIEEKIGEAITQIEKLMKDYRWDRARQEIERLMKLFPRHERVLGLPKTLAALRDKHKQELLVQWKQVLERSDVDQGIAILTELDQYLSRAEAETLRADAKKVFKEHLLNMGVQFSLAVAESRWRDALEIGLQIRQEYPNSRIAAEVGQRLDTLRIRAGYVKDAEVIQRR